MNSNNLNSNEKILLHATAMYKEACKEEMKVLRTVDEKKYTEYFTNRFYELHVNFPAIFNLIARDGDKFDMNRLKDMLRLKDRVDKNEISSESASEKIGKQYFNEYCAGKVQWNKEKDAYEDINKNESKD